MRSPTSATFRCGRGSGGDALKTGERARGREGERARGEKEAFSDHSCNHSQVMQPPGRGWVRAERGLRPDRRESPGPRAHHPRPRGPPSPATHKPTEREPKVNRKGTQRMPLADLLLASRAQLSISPRRCRRPRPLAVRQRVPRVPPRRSARGSSTQNARRCRTRTLRKRAPAPWPNSSTGAPPGPRRRRARGGGEEGVLARPCGRETRYYSNFINSIVVFHFDTSLRIRKGLEAVWCGFYDDRSRKNCH
jgi:hypothetical protein